MSSRSIAAAAARISPASHGPPQAADAASTREETKEARAINAVKAASKAAEADMPAPRGFLNLPDETLTRILSLVASTHFTDYVHSRTPIPISCLLICKRVHRLARPIWLASLRNPDQIEGAGMYFSKALSGRNSAEGVRVVDLQVRTHEPTVYLTLIARLLNLDLLVLDLPVNTSQESPRVVAAALTRPLRQLPVLRRLELDAELGQSALERLTLDFDALTDAQGGFMTSELLQVLTLLASSRIHRLDIRTSIAIQIPQRLPDHLSIPLTSLVITGCLKIHECLADVCAFLHLFPKLASLYLDGASFSAGRIPLPSHQPGLIAYIPGEVAVHLPHLVAFLAFLRASTAILDFRYRAYMSRREMRWTRATLDGEFVAECWTV
ncbi:hypothetical protein JCM10296v2_000377 [Rhodotorula toruloides]